MNRHVVLLSVPGLREKDLDRLPQLGQHMSAGSRSPLTPSFPCVTWPVQAGMLTGKTPAEHGVIGNGFFWRDTQQVEMWTAWNDRITAPQIWDRLHQKDPTISSAVWFPMLSKGCGADYVCMPAPIHNPDGSEDLWCYTKPTELYGELRDRLGHFPLQHFWGPLAGIPSSNWIVDSAIVAARRFRPNFFYVYLPHLDYAAQRTGPDSEPAMRALAEMDELLGRLFEQLATAYDSPDITWIVASEYAIVPVDHFTQPAALGPEL
ncbi:MAG: alkaline phosphatase family protein, partial [Planctomycetes bacterium]|nr:alkaline phosphatase family protein [Planctomycetota bacterium]